MIAVRPEYSRGCWHSVAHDNLIPLCITLESGLRSMALVLLGFYAKTDTWRVVPFLEV